MAHTIRCARAKNDRCRCDCDGAHHGEEATELDRTDPEPLDINPAPLLPDNEPEEVRPLSYAPRVGVGQVLFTFV